MDILGWITYQVDAFFYALQDLSVQQRDIIGVAVLFVGILFAYLGIRFFKYLLALAGFLSGAVIGMTVFYYIPGINTTGEIGQLAVAAAVGAIGAALFYFIFYFAGIFVFGALAAMWLGMIFLPRFHEMSTYRLLFILGFGFVGGLLAFFMRKTIIVFFTAAIGAVLVVMGLGHFNSWPLSATNFSASGTFNGQFLDAIFNHSAGVIIIATTCFVFVSGFLIQMVLFKNRLAEKSK